ncbi:Thiol-disulfide isomerase or thioredoxin [Zhouia amylolytica]|uniref:Thioredoxin family protein n=2 Tax=Zhouia amylolytica TaxID=376730 RepID=W2UR64_9FLAO|nr:TlpA disulfide reductase family protein [Zhouia amylolytica]ETN96434.1 thioredoxin family protein [Zhouia amylolytica AD3]MCQ0112677.1 TlpA family protein disulfide reductase [Zhouia amylolytica]SFS83244.1 Thiol-disulfide isomerase or thioredoxin [Zhouia amylolytica]
MKKILFSAVIASAIISCQKEQKVDYTLIQGKIDNATAKEVVIKGNDFSKAIALKEDGTFADTLRVNSGYYSLAEGRESTTIYLEPGYNINVTLDTKEFDETITYTGNGAENSNFLASKFLIEEKEAIAPQELYKLEEEAFKAKIQEDKDKIAKSLGEAQNLDEDFVALETKNINYDYLSKLATYTNAHRYLTKNNDFVPSEGFEAELAELDFNNEADYNNFAGYQNLVKSHYNEKIATLDSTTTIADVLTSIEAKSIKNDLAQMLSYRISPSNENSEELYLAIMDASSNEEFKQKLEKKYTTIQKLAKGNPSPSFDGYENYKGGTTSLEDLKGKYVYVDVWATWCGPCKREIPFLKEVEKEYHGKDIEFVSISVDKAADKEKWKQMVADKELKGVQLFADKDWSSDFVKNYAITGIPRFILIDPDGNIISADAPRPSNPKLKETLNTLL